ncbi:MAG: sigma-54-dependent transcriptional regulator [Bdellovibrionota bacterium]
MAATGKREKQILKNYKDKILVVDDEKMIRWSLSEALRGWGFEPVEAETASVALAAFESEPPAAVLLDINLPDGSGLDVLRKMRQREPDAVVIMITANVLVDETIAALRGGAYDFIGKPINLEELQVAIRNGIETSRLRREVKSIRRERAQQFSFGQIIGQSPAIREMLAMAQKVAESEVSSVLLQGESGTGKDLVAKAIHYHSNRADGPFIAINCAALPGTLIESELFGYEKGAFTDAKARKEGMFEQAEGGTLLLDEIGELELSLQAKLLRVLEDQVIRRVGGLRDIQVDVRVIAASNRDLEKAVRETQFRQDLYYRLAIIAIFIPPLRERKEDILPLVDFFIERYNRRFRKTIRGISDETRHLILAHNWPGNVRELKNTIERGMILEEESYLRSIYLPFSVGESGGRTLFERTSPADGGRKLSNGRALPRLYIPEGGTSLEELEHSMVELAMSQAHGNQTNAAKLLDISRDALRYKLKKFSMAPADDEI